VLHEDDGPAIAAAFGLGPDGVLAGPVARGEVGQVWRLSSPAGTFAVKEPFATGETGAADDADDQARFQELASASGVPAPRVVRTTGGRVVADIAGTPVRVYGWVDLLPPDRALDPAAVGAAIADLHRVDHHGVNGIDPWYVDPVGRDSWDALAAGLRAAGASFAPQFADRIDELVALEALLRPPADVRTCHRDLFADNVVGTPAGGVCIIDWENSGLADVSQELALVLFEFGGADGGRARPLYESYRDRGGPGTVDRPESFSMVIAQIGHIGELSARRWLATTAPDERARNQGRIEEVLGVGITRDHIDRILDAL
jgi:aminoglycoside phosphotransferase (APT) family kinase protein